jgi:hypothetical protein
MAETGLSEYCLNIHDFEQAGLIKRLASVEGHMHEILQQIRETTRRFSGELDAQYRLIFSMLMKNSHGAGFHDAGL